jgi:cell division protein FtsB
VVLSNAERQAAWQARRKALVQEQAKEIARLKREVAALKRKVAELEASLSKYTT